ncbi:RNA polymerase III-inhibiting protein MAF1 [Sporobolomyces salmoneus]|uniref:RNA polymerase III-inhibiting protein MAF1 n=1 Tax=Sporobolomyces salmoneus TaxID=183962 RepID=UPI00317601B5
MVQSSSSVKADQKRQNLSPYPARAECASLRALVKIRLAWKYPDLLHTPIKVAPFQPKIKLGELTMKFLEIAELDVLSNALCMSNPTLKLTTRIEAYSCKQVAKERKLFKTLESEFVSDLSLSTSISPPEHHQGLLESAFGPLDKPQSRKTLWLLIGLLNVAFPDHDFSKVRPEDFRREEGPRAVLASLSTALDHLRSPSGQRSFSAYPSSFPSNSSPYSDPISLPSTSTPNFSHASGGGGGGGGGGGSGSHNNDSIRTDPFLRQVLDPIIDLAECEVFTYSPDMDSDPHAADSDDEEDDSGDDDAFERDDDVGMAFEMDGVESSRSSSSSSARSYGSRPSPFIPAGGPSTPHSKRSSQMKSISSVFPPGTPGSTNGDFSEDYFSESSTGGLLWSTFQFLYNKKLKRIVFINAWAKTPPSETHRPKRRNVATLGGGGGTKPKAGPINDIVVSAAAQLKRSASTSSVSSISSSIPVQQHKKVKA